MAGQMTSFYKKVYGRYKVVAIIPKEKFKKGGKYHTLFFKSFNKKIYKKVAPKLHDLFRKLNGGKLKSTVVIDAKSLVPVVLRDIDYKMIDALRKLGNTVNDDMYKAGIVISSKGKEVPILDILKTKATKVRGYKSLKEQYEKTKNENIKKELEFFDNIISMKILDETSKIDIRKLAIYNKSTKIVFTYDFRAIASQSTEVGWKSCMSFDNGGPGGFAEDVGSGAGAGSFIAYLAKSGDEYTLASPTARVLFKPYIGEHTGDVIWKASRIYGMAPSSFKSTSQNIIDKYIKPKNDKYYIAKNVYKDDDDPYIDNMDWDAKEQNDVTLREIHDNPELVLKIENPTEMQKSVAIEREPSLITDIKDPSESLMIKAVTLNGFLIKHIENPSEDVQIKAVSQYPTAIQWIKEPTEKAQLESVQQQGINIQYIKNPSEKVQEAACRAAGTAIQYIDNPSENVQMRAIRDNGLAIQYIKDPSEALQIESVKRSSGAIRYLKDPSDEVKFNSVNYDPVSIQFIENPSKELQLLAVSKVGTAIRYIKNPTEEAKLMAVSRDSYAIDHIADPSDKVKLAAIEYRPTNIKRIKNPTKEMWMAAINKESSLIESLNESNDDFGRFSNLSESDLNDLRIMAVKRSGSLIKLIDNQTPELQMISIKDNPRFITFIKNPTEEVQLYAVKEDPLTINKIENPTEKVQLEAVKRDPYVINDIKNPTDEVKQLYKDWQDKRPSLLETLRQSQHGYKYDDKPFPVINAKLSEVPCVKDVSEFKVGDVFYQESYGKGAGDMKDDINRRRIGYISSETPGKYLTYTGAKVYGYGSFMDKYLKEYNALPTGQGSHSYENFVNGNYVRYWIVGHE